MNIIFYIDDGQHLLGHTQEITCIELDLLVYLIKHIFYGILKGQSGIWQLRPPNLAEVSI